MHSCILVRWRLSRACTLRAFVKSKRSCIVPWPTHGLRSESCACASASRKQPHLPSNLTSRTFGGYSRQRNEHETGSWKLERRVAQESLSDLADSDHRSWQSPPLSHLTSQPCSRLQARGPYRV